MEHEEEVGKDPFQSPSKQQTGLPWDHHVIPCVALGVPELFSVSSLQSP